MLIGLVSFGTLSHGAARSISFKTINGFKKSADILDTLQVNSAAECAVRCTKMHNCAWYNLAQTNNELNSRTCELVQGGTITMVAAATDWDLFVGTNVSA